MSQWWRGELDSGSARSCRLAENSGRGVGLTVGSLAVLELALEAVGEDGLDIGSRKLAN